MLLLMPRNGLKEKNLPLLLEVYNCQNYNTGELNHSIRGGARISPSIIYPKCGSRAA
jgi:hypothetical protein